MKEFFSFASKPVGDVHSLLVQLQQSMYLNSHQSPQTCSCLRLALSLYYKAWVHLVIWCAKKKKMSVCHRCLDLPHADCDRVKAGGYELELSVNGTRD